MLMSPAPGFCAQAYHNGAQTEVCLSQYQDKWLLLLFYASNFSFV